MAPVATNEERGNASVDRIAELKSVQAKPIDETKLINPFYSPSVGNENDDDYQYAKYKVSDLKAFFQSQCAHISLSLASLL
jgi:sulfonate dioxygenase